MGWCSGTEIFDKVAATVLDSDLSEEKQVEIITVLIEALSDQDWDCESDSDYYKHPIIERIYREKYPHWFEED
jgi:hypothetical protein